MKKDRLDIDKLVKGFIKSEKHKAAKLKAFYKLDFDNRLDWLNIYLKPGDSINNEELNYFPKNHPGISYEELNNIFRCLDIYSDIKWVQKPVLKFPMEECKFKGLIFTRIYGQGTALIISKPKTKK